MSSSSSVGSPTSPTDGWISVDEELTKVKSKKQREVARGEAPAQVSWLVDLMNSSHKELENKKKLKKILSTPLILDKK